MPLFRCVLVQHLLKICEDSVDFGAESNNMKQLSGKYIATQVIQAVTFSSPNVRAHDSPLKKKKKFQSSTDYTSIHGTIVYLPT